MHVLRARGVHKVVELRFYLHIHIDMYGKIHTKMENFRKKAFNIRPAAEIF